MKLKARRLMAGGAFSLAYLCFVCATQAALIAYEGFSYPIGSALPGQNGGLGWTGAWIGPNLGGGATGSDLPITVGTGVNWTNGPGYIASSGNGIYDHDASSHGDARQWFDPSTNITATWGTNIWF